MNPVFLMVNDLPKVKATIRQNELRKAFLKVEEWASVVAQNIGYMESGAPVLSELAKPDALSAAKELAQAVAAMVEKIKAINDENQ